MKKRTLEIILYWLARFILIRRDPTVIAVTGNVGKTSAKEAIALVLGKKYSVRASRENYNNEIGVPLTIIGAKSGGKNPFAWLGIMVKAVITGLFPLPYPAMLVLEMGADTPGDLKYLTTLAPADVGIVTAITETPTHVQAFKNVDQVAKEKLVMYKQLSKLSWGIVNADEPRVQPILDHPKFRMMTVGIDQPADLIASEIDCVFDAAVLAAEHNVSHGEAKDKDEQRLSHVGMRFKFHYQGNVVPCFMPGVIGEPVVYSALFAAAVGLIYDMNLIDITLALRQYQAPPGRMRLLPGKNHSMIIDDSYNAAPSAMRAAITTLQSLSTVGRKIVCLGEMAELGEQSQSAHQRIGAQLAEAQIDLVCVVGEAGQWMAAAAVKHGLSEEAMQHFPTSEAAAHALSTQLSPHDLVLIKGSQSVRMEKVVASTMAHPEDAPTMLVRQYGHWNEV